jgi:hypothetical protein
VALIVTLGITASSLSASAAVHPNTFKETLAKSIPPSPAFQVNGACGTSGANDTAACTAMVLKTIDNARKFEPLPNVPGSFSVSGFDALTPGEQLFAIADIERTARGLLPIEGLTLQLHQIALTAARDQNDPSASLPLRLTGGGEAYYYGSNFAEGTAGPIGANYFWMYDDGLNSPNADCTTKHTEGCWGHRKNVLGDYNDANYCPRGSAVNTVMGAAEVTSGVLYTPSITEIFVNDCGALPTMDFTWPDVQKLVFGH